jgi:hypothetical protein
MPAEQAVECDHMRAAAVDRMLTAQAVEIDQMSAVGFAAEVDHMLTVGAAADMQIAAAVEHTPSGRAAAVDRMPAGEVVEVDRALEQIAEAAQTLVE